jgi:hypothetical protein
LEGNSWRRNLAAVLAFGSLLLKTIPGVKYETELTFGFSGGQNLVRDVIDPQEEVADPPEVVDPPKEALPAASNAAATAAPGSNAPVEASTSAPQTSATHEPSCTMNPCNSKESS